MDIAHTNNAQILVVLIFGFFGFILAYYLRRGLNIVIFGIFLYASLKGLEQLKFAADWDNFHQFVSLFQQMSKTMLMLINNMVATAGTLSIVFFLTGGVAGLAFSKRGA